MHTFKKGDFVYAPHISTSLMEVFYSDVRPEIPLYIQAPASTQRYYFDSSGKSSDGLIRVVPSHKNLNGELDDMYGCKFEVITASTILNKLLEMGAKNVLCQLEDGESVVITQRVGNTNHYTTAHGGNIINIDITPIDAMGNPLTVNSISEFRGVQNVH